MPQSEPNSKVTLEQLLRLKRAERPSAEFWANFERELHQKQLTALVKKRRWWHNMSFMLARRAYLPAGAAAVIAFTLVSVRSTSPHILATSGSHSPKVVVSDPQVETLAPTTVSAGSESIASVRYDQVAPLATNNLTAEVSFPENAQVKVITPASTEMQSPSSRSIAANLARLEQSEPELVNAVMGSRLSAPARFETVASVQPETVKDSAFESAKKYRLIARYADRTLSPEPLAPAGVRERIARRLGDDLGEGISRIGVVGSRVSLKF